MGELEIRQFTYKTTRFFKSSHLLQEGLPDFEGLKRQVYFSQSKSDDVVGAAEMTFPAMAAAKHKFEILNIIGILRLGMMEQSTQVSDSLTITMMNLKIIRYHDADIVTSLYVNI